MSAIPPHIAITYQSTSYTPLKRETPPATEDPPMPEPTPLSPAAQAVDEAAHNAWVTKDAPRPIAAAVLRAAANFGEYLHDSQDGKTAVVRVADLEAWATELEVPNV